MGPPQQSFTVQNAQELMDRLDDTGCAAAPAGHGPKTSLLRCCHRSDISVLSDPNNAVMPAGIRPPVDTAEPLGCGAVLPRVWNVL